MRRKLRTFESFLSEGELARTFHREDFEVVIVESSSQRLNNIAGVAGDVISPDRWDAYLFATKTILHPSRFQAADWHCLDSSGYDLRFRDGKGTEDTSRGGILVNDLSLTIRREDRCPR